jgi:hypothetical protein
MNVIHHIFSRFITRVINVSVNQLPTNICNMIANIISHIWHMKNDKEQMR